MRHLAGQHTNSLQSHARQHLGTVKHVGIALFNGFALLETASIIDVFQSANALIETNRLRRPYYDVSLLSAVGGKVASSSSIFVCTESIAARQQADKLHALFIAGGASVCNSLHDVRLIRWLRRASHSTPHICPTTGGGVSLEEAGLAQFVSGRTHAERRGNVGRKRLGTEACHDSASPLRVALGVVQDDLGPEIAGQIAICTQTFIETPFASTVRKNNSALLSEQVQVTAKWLEDHCDQSISIGDAARIAAMSERHFLRRFSAEMGLSPSEYLLQVRLDRSCRLLIETKLPIDKIARRCGIGGGGQLSKLFRANLATTPTEYRSKKQQSRGF
ncbi:MAG TPA: helix-turn-helix domain-containing protein [Paraburkholderia sp.]|nr:helix-turn-helix domain-containing protein [Paraburkholderia sp.]